MTTASEQTPLVSKPKQSSVERVTPTNIRDESNSHSPHSLHGYCVVALAAFLQSVRATCIHSILILTPLPAAMSLLTQAITFVSISLFTIRMNKISPWNITRKSFFLLCVRSVMSGTMMTFNLFTLQSTSVGTALTLFSTAPAIASVLSVIFLKYKIPLLEVLFIFINMYGIYLVASPSSNIDSHHNEAGKLISPSLGILYGFTTSFLMAAGLTLVKVMGSNVHYTLNVIAIGIGCALCLPFLTSPSEIVSFISRYPVIFACLLGVSSVNFLSQALLNYALQFCRPGSALVVRSLNVPISFVLGFIFLRETPTLLELIGVVLVLGSVTYIGARNIKPAQRRSWKFDNKLTLVKSMTALIDIDIEHTGVFKESLTLFWFKVFSPRKDCI